ncbi:hypothetical protein T02_5066 [Trichinella nativa]|uniref:Uncharacterized protein n=2 Tax=Trichinella TaxID=6333 RepID=A0A0V1L4W9_9BILA|nr:hypothetical protein T05_6280 [Trichinella murrelli]KRZ54568.1 hypothetical protein T02_5066 [Trichinella nativa]
MVLDRRSLMGLLNLTGAYSSGLHRSRPSTKQLESDVAITAAPIQLFVQSFNGSSAAQLLRTYNIDDAQFRPFERHQDVPSFRVHNRRKNAYINFPITDAE